MINIFHSQGEAQSKIGTFGFVLSKGLELYTLDEDSVDYGAAYYLEQALKKLAFNDIFQEICEQFEDAVKEMPIPIFIQLSTMPYRLYGSLRNNFDYNKQVIATKLIPSKLARFARSGFKDNTARSTLIFWQPSLDLNGAYLAHAVYHAYINAIGGLHLGKNYEPSDVDEHVNLLKISGCYDRAFSCEHATWLNKKMEQSSVITCTAQFPTAPKRKTLLHRALRRTHS